MSFRETFLDIAEREIGVVEEGGNNVGDQIVLYQSATWLKPGPWPWCAAFVAFVLRQTIIEWPNAPFTMKTRCKDARAYGWEEWGAAHGCELLDENQPALPGDIVTFDFSHIGIVKSDGGEFIYTIEGNTNEKGDRDSVTGDGVHRKVRRRELVKTFIRLPEQ